MALDIMRNIYEEGRTRTYQTATFNFENAPSNAYSIVGKREQIFTPTQSVIHSLRFNITATGLDYLSGYVKDVSSPQNLIKPLKYKLVNTVGDVKYYDVDGAEKVAEPGERPEDFGETFKWKYYTREAISYPDISNPTHIWYKYNTVDTYDSTKSYYTLPEDVGTAVFYTQRGAFFGVQRLLRNSTADYTQENIGVITRAGAWSDTYWYRESGASGKLLFYPATGTGFGGIGYIGTMQYNGNVIDNLDTFVPKSIFQFVEFKYEDRTYYGVAHIHFTADGVPVGAEVCSVSYDFWVKPKPDYYVGPKSQSGGGHGSYSAPDERKGKRGRIAEGYKIGNVAPGVAGWKLTKMNLNVLSEIQTVFYSRIQSDSFWSKVSIGPQEALNVFQNSIMSVYKLPIEPYATDTQRQWEIAGDAFDIGSVIYWNMDHIEYEDFGSVSLTNPWYDSYLDYEPYTKIFIYLPFIGEFELPTADVMGGYINLEYYQDNLNGDLLARVSCENYGFPIKEIRESGLSPYQHLIGQFVGNGLMTIPFTAQMASTAYGIGQMAKAFLGGGSADVVASGVRSGANALANRMMGYAPPSPPKVSLAKEAPIGYGVGQMGAAGPNMINKLGAGLGAAAAGASAAAPLIMGAVNAAMTASRLSLTPATTSVIGSYSGNSGYMSDPTPYIKVVRVLYDEPENYEEEKAYPSNITYKLRNLPQGSFNVCSTNISFADTQTLKTMSEDEKNAITQILNSGFYR